MSTTRDALVQAAARLLDEGGVEAVTLREVGRLAGVSHNAPYKHFAGKEALLAAVAAQELRSRLPGLRETALRDSPQAALRTVLHDYIGWALAHPARFKLVFGPWTIDSEELGEAATAAQGAFVELVAAAQEAGALPPGDPVRVASLLRALAHGAADLAVAGHLAAEGKGGAGPQELVDDLLAYLSPNA
ncbi:TetR/AcrR family transcriptional regulator [Glycomyces harbinensis]|uniref:Transcriptional regulator, TetR family n=1 Tax=Glycomyces harbinensis TaxID=58114 RepID=A0A1G7CFI0_9ACTN|nr:TetR/AcrR family transcriptional regulator [Glycomyces harbinensis]SDE37500.1 transcriptional regulator, TetR family [Glycomyces harbinensis]